VSCIPNITARLLARGYPEAHAQQILGSNWLRVIRQVMGQ